MASKLWEIADIDPLQYYWKKSDEILVPVWFIGPQFPPSVLRRKRDNGYEADDEKKQPTKGSKRTRSPRGGQEWFISSHY